MFGSKGPSVNTSSLLISTPTPSPVSKIDRRKRERLRKRDILLKGEGRAWNTEAYDRKKLKNAWPS
jgi:hypothetical protein